MWSKWAIVWLVLLASASVSVAVVVALLWIGHAITTGWWLA